MDANALKERIISWLNKADYKVVTCNDGTITFNLQGWGSNGKQFDKINGGTFEISESGEESVLEFRYYFSFTFEILFILLFIIMSFIKGGQFLFLLTFLLLILVIRHFAAKAKCQEVINKLVAE